MTTTQMEIAVVVLVLVVALVVVYYYKPELLGLPAADDTQVQPLNSTQATGANQTVQAKQAPSYTKYANSDHWGDDIARNYVSLAATQAACDADPKCLAFNSAGYYKSGASVDAKSSPGMDLYVKN